MSTLTCCSCCNLQCCSFLLLPLIIMWSHPAPKWILREFDLSRIRPRLAWVSSPWNVDMAKFDLSWEGYPVWHTGLPTLKGDPTYHVNVIKLKWEIIWTGGLPHLSGLPFLPGVPCAVFWSLGELVSFFRLWDQILFCLFLLCKA